MPQPPRKEITVKKLIIGLLLLTAGCGAAPKEVQTVQAAIPAPLPVVELPTTTTTTPEPVKTIEEVIPTPVVVVAPKPKPATTTTTIPPTTTTIPPTTSTSTTTTVPPTTTTTTTAQGTWVQVDYAKSGRSPSKGYDTTDTKYRVTGSCASGPSMYGCGVKLYRGDGYLMWKAALGPGESVSLEIDLPVAHYYLTAGGGDPPAAFVKLEEWRQ